MKDILKQGDGVDVGLQCGHPNVQRGETCSLCGAVMPHAEDKSSDEEDKNGRIA